MTETKRPLDEQWSELMGNLNADPALTKVFKDTFFNGAMVTLDALRRVGRDVVLAEIKEYLEENRND
jgi:hypothetical protein